MKVCCPVKTNHLLFLLFMELKFLNKFENAMFARLNPLHEPKSGKLVIHALVGGAIVSLIVFVLQMTSMSHDTIDVVAGVLLFCLFAYMAKKSFDTIKAFPGWGGRIGYSVYMAVITFVAFYLAMVLVMVALLGLFLYVIVKVFFSSGNKGKKWKVTYADGHEEEAEESGTGICGEKYIRTKDGREYQV